MKIALLWVGLILTVALVLVTGALPGYMLRPFAPQDDFNLTVAHFARSWGRILVFFVALGGLALAFRLIKQHQKIWLRGLAVLLWAPALAGIWLAWQEPAELQFKPLDNPDYTHVSEVDWVEDEDMVMVVAREGEAAAYPMLQVAYHHIIHDRVGDVPIAVTY